MSTTPEGPRPRSPHVRLGPLRWRLMTLGCLFAVTGVTAIWVEQVSERLLSTVVGGSTPASAVVLAVFFSGLSLGGVAYGALGWPARQPLRLYAILELVIGLWAGTLWATFGAVQSVSSAIVHLGGQSLVGVFLVRFFVSCFWILLPTVLMGMTFPAVVGALQQLRVPRVQRLMSQFYALNLLGAVVGAAMAPYVVFPRYGLGGALLMVAVAEVLVFTCALLASRGIRSRVSVHSGGDTSMMVRILQGLRATISSVRTTLLLALAFASGFLTFGFEVLWVHLISCVIGSSVYGFGVMLTCVLGGLFLGGLMISQLFAGRSAVPGWWLPFVLTASAGALSLTFGAWDQVPGLLGRWGAGLSAFAEGELLRFIFAAGLVGFPAVLLGMVYPTIFRLPWFPRVEADRMAGVLGAVNAVGSIMGSLAIGFVLLPGLGSEVTYRLLTFAGGLLGLAFAAHDLLGGIRNRARRYRLVFGLGLVVAALILVQRISIQRPWDGLALTSGTNVYFREGHVTAKSKLVFWHEDTYGGFTTVVENARDATIKLPDVRMLLTNGKFQGNDAGEMPAQICFALIPILHEPTRDRALVIGLGTGHSAEIVAASGYRSIDIAEISPGIVEAARTMFGHVNRDLLSRDNVHLHLEDGRNFLLRTNAIYNLITMEISSIWFAGSTNLYSREFYSLVRQHLAEDGVFQQWIQFHHIGPKEVACCVSTLRHVFPHVTVWMAGGQGILVASPSRLHIDPAAARSLAVRPSLTRDLMVLSGAEGATIDLLPRHLLLDEDDTTRVVQMSAAEGIPLNTDANRFLEYTTPRHNLERVPHVEQVIRYLLKFADPDEVQPRLSSAR